MLSRRLRHKPKESLIAPGHQLPVAVVMLNSLQSPLFVDFYPFSLSSFSICFSSLTFCKRGFLLFIYIFLKIELLLTNKSQIPRGTLRRKDGSLYQQV